MKWNFPVYNRKPVNSEQYVHQNPNLCLRMKYFYTKKKLEYFKTNPAMETLLKNVLKTKIKEFIHTQQ